MSGYIINVCFAEPKYPDAETLEPSDTYSEQDIHKMLMAQRRFSAYRSLVFWCYPDIHRGVRRALPSCVYALVRALYPPTDDEEEFAEMEHTVYISEDEDEL